MKCSGEVPCSTCEEREIACEGQTERKRPTKNAGRRSRASSARRSSQDLGSEDGTAPWKRKSFDSSSATMDRNEEPVHCPTMYLRKRATGNSEDSGYASGTQSRQENAADPTLQLDTQFPFSISFGQTTSSHRNDTPATSSSENAHHDWNLAGHLEVTGLSATENTGSGLSQSAPATTAALPLKFLDWLDEVDRSEFWIDDNASAHAATKLLIAAQALEQQAMSLRKLADQEPAEARRQTFPIYNQYATPMNNPTQLLPGPYDDLSLMLGERMSRTGLTPLAGDFDSWWDVRPELSQLYGVQPHTTTDQHAGTVPCVPHVPSAESLWPCASASYNSASIIAAPSKPAKLSEQGIDARQAAPRHYGQPQNAYGRLYPWPE